MKLYFDLRLSSLVISAITRAHLLTDLYIAVKNAKPGNEKKTYTKRNLGLGFVSYVIQLDCRYFYQGRKKVLGRTPLYRNYSTKIRVMGFFAGRHLTSSLATHHNEQVVSNPEHTSLRPDFTARDYNILK